MGYLDTGYQRPASMVAAAKAHKQRGSQAAALLLNVKGFEGRNATRRAAFNNNWDNWGTASFSRDVQPMQNLTWVDYQAKNQPLFQQSLQLTPQEETLLDTPALAFYNPEYEDTQAPNYKPSALQEAIKLDDNVWRDSNNPLNAYFALTGLMNNDAQ
jgi:hypothetical protein